MAEPLLTVVIPTYNERENIAPLLARVHSALQDIDYEVLFVDDNSPDGTADVIAEEASKDPRVRLLLRKGKRGLASAIFDGMAQARGKYVAVMDADLQHPPELLPAMLKEAERREVDIVVASRYVKGGGVRGWNPVRRLISWGATVIARLLVPEVRRTTDPMSGFFLVRRNSISLSDVDPVGFKALMELMFRNPKAKVFDMPYVFSERLAGRSKMGTKTVLEFLWHVIKISRPIKFAIVGASGTAVNLGVAYLLLHLAGLPYYISYVGSIEASILSNFAFNDNWTFRDRRSRPLYSRVFRYHVMVAPAGLTIYTVASLLAKITHFNPLVTLFIGIVAGFVVNYMLSARHVWILR